MLPFLEKDGQMNISLPQTSSKQTSDAPDKAAGHLEKQIHLPSTTETGSLANMDQRASTVTLVLTEILTEVHPVARWGINE